MPLDRCADTRPASIARDGLYTRHHNGSREPSGSSLSPTNSLLSPLALFASLPPAYFHPNIPLRIRQLWTRHGGVTQTDLPYTLAITSTPPQPIPPRIASVLAKYQSPPCIVFIDPTSHNAWLRKEEERGKGEVVRLVDWRLVDAAVMRRSADSLYSDIAATGVTCEPQREDEGDEEMDQDVQDDLEVDRVLWEAERSATGRLDWFIDGTVIGHQPFDSYSRQPDLSDNLQRCTGGASGARIAPPDGISSGSRGKGRAEAAVEQVNDEQSIHKAEAAAEGKFQKKQHQSSHTAVTIQDAANAGVGQVATDPDRSSAYTTPSSSTKASRNSFRSANPRYIVQVRPMTVPATPASKRTPVGEGDIRASRTLEAQYSSPSDPSTSTPSEDRHNSDTHHTSPRGTPPRLPLPPVASAVPLPTRRIEFSLDFRTADLEIINPNTGRPHDIAELIRPAFQSAINDVNARMAGMPFDAVPRPVATVHHAGTAAQEGLECIGDGNELRRGMDGVLSLVQGGAVHPRQERYRDEAADTGASPLSGYHVPDHSAARPAETEGGLQSYGQSPAPLLTRNVSSAESSKGKRKRCSIDNEASPADKSQRLEVSVCGGDGGLDDDEDGEEDSVYATPIGDDQYDSSVRDPSPAHPTRFLRPDDNLTGDHVPFHHHQTVEIYQPDMEDIEYEATDTEDDPAPTPGPSTPVDMPSIPIPEPSIQTNTAGLSRGNTSSSSSSSSYWGSRIPPSGRVLRERPTNASASAFTSGTSNSAITSTSTAAARKSKAKGSRGPLDPARDMPNIGEDQMGTDPFLDAQLAEGDSVVERARPAKKQRGAKKAGALSKLKGLKGKGQKAIPVMQDGGMEEAEMTGQASQGVHEGYDVYGPRA